MDKERIQNAVREILIAVGGTRTVRVYLKHLKESQICMRKFLQA